MTEFGPCVVLLLFLFVPDLEADELKVHVGLEGNFGSNFDRPTLRFVL